MLVRKSPMLSYIHYWRLHFTVVISQFDRDT